MSGMRAYKAGEVGRRTAFGQRAGGAQVGQEHFLAGTENLIGLSHEVHAAHHNDVGIGLGGFLGQGQAVAHKVRHILNVAFRVIVRHDDGLLLAAQAAYLFM